MPPVQNAVGRWFNTIVPISCSMLPALLEACSHAIMNEGSEKTVVWEQALLRDLQASPIGRLHELQGQPMLLEAFLETVEPAPMASASIAQVDQLHARHDCDI